MTLYHGSTEIVEKPGIITGDKFLDFGFGFYTTTSKEQALRWAEIKKKRIMELIETIDTAKEKK